MTAVTCALGGYPDQRRWYHWSGRLCRSAARGRTHPPRVQTLLEVTRCLRKLHAAGYVHRDIKPDNLLRVKRGGHSEWKLIDCGLAAPVGTVVKPACTPQFAPPEVLNARAKRVTITADPALDSWSLGVTAFRLICPQAARNFFTLDHDEVRPRARHACPSPPGHLPLPPHHCSFCRSRSCYADALHFCLANSIGYCRTRVAAL